MAPYPPKETPLTEHEKAAYRYLLYQAMLDIRMYCQSRGPETWNPLEWRRQYRLSRIAGTIADWLHNLAMYAALDFHGFNTEQFWREHEGVCRRFHEFEPGSYMDYRQRYDKYLAELKEPNRA